MGIRYYAYAFDAEVASQVVAEPLTFVSGDPLADAWGFEPHAAAASPTFQQIPSRRDMLYLDKAWRELQTVTGPSPGHQDARPAFRMFEGQVTMGNGGWSWSPWVRAILPGEVPTIRDDLLTIDKGCVRERIQSLSPIGDDLPYALEYLERAQEFMRCLAADGRGMVYVIQ